MSDRKSRREIDKAILHLLEYQGPNNEWAGRLEELEYELLVPVAEKLDLSLDEASEYFFDGYYGHMAFGFLFEEYATVRWDNEEHSLIDTYLKHRGWREGPAGRRYLQALGQSELKFWEVTAVKPGAHVDIRKYGTKEKSIRVKEKAATESMVQWDGLAARVLPMGKGNIFSGAMLPFNPEVAARVQTVLDEVAHSTLQMMQELVDDGTIDALPDDMDTQTLETLNAELPLITFLFWAVDTYISINRPTPGNVVGSPLTVNEDLALFDEEDEAFDLDTEFPPEIQEAIDAHLDNHYRQTLDDPIPMLNGKTPRECAADPALKNDVIKWLKYMENLDKRSPQKAYDFTWMWDELKLKRE